MTTPFDVPDDLDQPFDADARGQRVLGLAAPFAAVGAYGGWVVARLLAGPVLRASSLRLPPAAACIGLAAGLGAGLTVHRAARRRLQLGDDPSEAFVLLRSVVPAGAVAGTLSLWIAEAAGFVSSLVIGVAAALALYPLCLYVTKAAVQAGRARLGSLVATADRRAMVGATAAALGVASAVECYEWGGLTDCWLPNAAQAWWSAHVGVAIAVVAASGSLAVLLGQALAWRRVRAWLVAAERMEPGDGHLADDDPLRVDLGLGEMCRREQRDHGTAYRHARRTVAVLRGDPQESVAAMRRLTLHAAVGALLGVGALVGHLAASDGARGATGCGEVAPAWGPPPAPQDWYP